MALKELPFITVANVSKNLKIPFLMKWTEILIFSDFIASQFNFAVATYLKSPKHLVLITSTWELSPQPLSVVFSHNHPKETDSEFFQIVISYRLSY